MSPTSKTGLLPILSKKKVGHEVQGTATLELPKIVVPAPISLKPFSGIYNPFPYGCSILCNHPADFEAKSTVKKAKEAWATEGRSLLESNEITVLRGQERVKKESEHLTLREEREEKSSEKLFQKYTETDSRPITPTPTLVSTVTKNLRIRRCVTPDPTSFLPPKEKTLLVLDLRRSHSQETLYWQAYPDANYDNDLQETITSKEVSPLSPGPLPVKKKKTQKKKTDSTSTITSNTKTPTSRDPESKFQTQHSLVSPTSPSKGSIIQEQETSSKSQAHSPENDLDEMSGIKRRGKKPKKGKKSGKGDKEFQGIPDPGETQVSALKNDSKEESPRQSLDDENNFIENQFEQNLPHPEPKPEKEDINSFLNRETLKRLQRQLDQEVVDSEQNAKRKVALEEALRHKKNPKHIQQGEEMKSLKKEFQILIKDSEKWLSIPRVFTRRSARFELPMDSRTLNNLTPMEYVQQYVYVSPERLVLYGHIFNLFKEDPEDDEERERVLLGKNVVDALSKVMGRALTEKEAKEFRPLLNWKDEARLDFRTFAGISATCERVMSRQFSSKMLTQKEDPRHEIEQADFETLNEKLLRLNPDRNLVKILRSVRDV